MGAAPVNHATPQLPSPANGKPCNLITPTPPVRPFFDRPGCGIPTLVFALLILGCSAADLVQRQQATPPATATLATLLPTFTPSPVPAQTLLIVTPPSEDRPGVIIIPPGMDPNSVLPLLPTNTPAPPPTQAPVMDTATPQPGVPTVPPGAESSPAFETTALPPREPAATPTLVPLIPTSTPTVAATPTPFVAVAAGLVALRTGPAIDYPLLAQLGPGIPVAIIGRNEDASWLEICCISGNTVWVVAAHVFVNNDISGVPVSFAAPPPVPTATPLPTETPTPTVTPTPTRMPFERAIGPQFFPTSNEYITIWAKLYIGVSPYEQPAQGYYLTVLYEGFERPNALGPNASRHHFEFSAPPGSGNRVQYNYKYEFHPLDPATLNSNAGAPWTRLQLIGTGTWIVYVSDGAGNRLSEEVTFTTAPSNPNREIYLGWVRVN